jgi:hypothetical protein
MNTHKQLIETLTGISKSAHYTLPDQVRNALAQAAESITTLDTVVDDLIKERDEAYAQVDALRSQQTNNDLTAINFVTEKPITICNVSRGLGLIAEFDIHDVSRLLSADVKFADDKEQQHSETVDAVLTAVWNELVTDEDSDYPFSDWIFDNEGNIFTGINGARVLISEKDNLIFHLDTYGNVQVYREQDAADFWRHVAELGSDYAHAATASNA